MKYKTIEVHKYAPELNKLIFENGATFNTPGLTTIKQIRKKYFKPVKPGKYVTIEYTNKHHKNLDATYSGFLKDGYLTLKNALDSLKIKHNMPGGIYDIKIKTI